MRMERAADPEDAEVSRRLGLSPEESNWVLRYLHIADSALLERMPPSRAVLIGDGWDLPTRHRSGFPETLRRISKAAR